MLSSPTATQRRPVQATPRRSAVVGARPVRQCRPSGENSTVPPEPTATQRPSATATPRRISSVGLGTPCRPEASVPSRIAPKSPTATTRPPAAASCHSSGREAIVLRVGIGNGRDRRPVGAVAGGDHRRLLSAQQQRGSDARTAPEDVARAARRDRPVDAVARGEHVTVAARTRRPGPAGPRCRAGRCSAGPRRRAPAPAAEGEDRPRSPTVIHRVPVHTTPRRLCTTGVGSTRQRRRSRDAATSPFAPTARTIPSPAATFASVRPPPGARAQLEVAEAGAANTSASNALSTATARRGAGDPRGGMDSNASERLRSAARREGSSRSRSTEAGGPARGRRRPRGSDGDRSESACGSWPRCA